MSAGPGVSNTPIVGVEGRPREIAGGAKIAAVLIAIAPWLAALVGAGQTLVLMRGLESSPLERLAYWGLVAMAPACAFFISRHLWRGVHDGGTAPVRLLLLSTLPFWLLSEAVGQFLAQYLLRAGNPWGFAEASMLRIAGQHLAWGLTGSVVFGLSISAFLWRAPARRLPGVALAWVSLAPIALFVVWVVGTIQVESLELRSSLIGYAWVSLPILLGFAGAALGDAPRAHPRPDWILGVGLGALIVFVSAASMAMGYALIEAQIAERGYQDAAATSADAITRAGRMAWFGLPLAALPLFGFAVRLQQWPSAAGWGMTLLPLAFLAIALLVDATGPGAEHGLAEAYPRRLWLLVAYAVLVPLAILALRRQVGGSDAFRDGLTLATALTGLMCLAWRPGLLLFAPPVRESAVFESAVPAAPDAAAVDAPPPPPPPPPKVVSELMPSGAEGIEAGAEAPSELGGIEGGTLGGLPAGVLGSTPDPAPALPATARIVQPDVLKGLRVSGAEVLPPPELYAGAPRMTVIVMMHVDAGGSVTQVELLRSSGNPELDNYVRASLRSWRFRPWMEQGRVTPIKSTLTFIFVNQT